MEVNLFHECFCQRDSIFKILATLWSGSGSGDVEKVWPIAFTARHWR